MRLCIDRSRPSQNPALYTPEYSLGSKKLWEPRQKSLSELAKDGKGKDSAATLAQMEYQRRLDNVKKFANANKMSPREAARLKENILNGQNFSDPKLRKEAETASADAAAKFAALSVVPLGATPEEARAALENFKNGLDSLKTSDPMNRDFCDRSIRTL